MPNIVYLLLAALYESYILPLAVIFSLPIGLAGVYLFVFVAMINGTGIVNNIYVQISLIMLIGLLAKNAILIVEYALQRRRKGMSISKAAISGAVADCVYFDDFASLHIWIITIGYSQRSRCYRK